MSDVWKELNVDWSDAEMVPAIRYPSTHIGGTPETIVMAQVKSFNRRISTPHDIIDGLNNGNMGRVIKHARFTLDITVFPYGKAFDQLMKCQAGRRLFDIVMAPATYFDAVQQDANVGQPDGTAWTVGKAVYRGAFINDKSEKFTISGEPSVTFSCGAFRYVWDQDLDGQDVIEIGNGFNGPAYTDTELKMTPELLRDSGGAI